MMEVVENDVKSLGLKSADALEGRGAAVVEKMVGSMLNQYFATKFWAGPMLESQKLVGSGPVQPVRWLHLWLGGEKL